MDEFMQVNWYGIRDRKIERILGVVSPCKTNAQGYYSAGRERGRVFVVFWVRSTQNTTKTHPSHPGLSSYRLSLIFRTGPKYITVIATKLINKVFFGVYLTVGVYDLKAWL